MAAEAFLTQARAVINPDLGPADVREMLIQHILTENIFAQIFSESEFHQKNNVAQALYDLEEKFFTGSLKKQTLKGLEPYYAAIRSAAALIASHSEKQTFLKVIYEQFYRVYNPKAADRLGVVYTPNEIVRFMIAGADWLCQQHFKRQLIDKDVDILDPATGTGTYICELLEYFRGQKDKLKHKYQHELHANEAAILPYYVANLNIEATYAGITGEYLDFPSLCFVDTLDNVGLHTASSGTTGDLFGAVSEENVARIKRQNGRRISVVIGNPPYNANQANENDNNKNRVYPAIDKRIKDTYIDASTAQKTKLYDMYARFFRWASDRLADDGILAFITNRSFLDSRTFDGFRKIVVDEFHEAWIVDLGGDWKKADDLRASGGNVFGIGTGVAISFWVKKSHRSNNKSPCRIHYISANQITQSATEKLNLLSNTSLQNMDYDDLRPDTRNNWLDLTENDFETFIPLASKETKAAKIQTKERAIFKLFSLGVVTNRDDWVYGESDEEVSKKVNYLINNYNAELLRQSSGQAVEYGTEIKWTRAVKADLCRNVAYQFDKTAIVEANYRPFVKRRLYFNQKLNEMQYQLPSIFGTGNTKNKTIIFTDPTAQKPWMVSVVDQVVDLHFVGAAAGAVCIPFQRLTGDGEFEDNITDWSLKKFRTYYKTLAPSPQPSPTGRGSKKVRTIEKEHIFQYCYAVLHDPIYRETYALNLKRDFPRIPFYPDFWRWADWGRALLDLHLGYEQAAPYPLKRIDTPDARTRAAGLSPKVRLRADPATGTIDLDSETSLSDIPPIAWTYRLGNRSALDWILDQYKEKTPKDPTIREHFNTYRFADHKAHVIDLLQRVTTVSVETMNIVEMMRTVARTASDLD
nr:type ISP restriction/modification enzyme [Allochromatium warmingii]